MGHYAPTAPCCELNRPTRGSASKIPNFHWDWALKKGTRKSYTNSNKIYISEGPNQTCGGLFRPNPSGKLPFQEVKRTPDPYRLLHLLRLLLTSLGCLADLLLERSKDLRMKGHFHCVPECYCSFPLRLGALPLQKNTPSVNYQLRHFDLGILQGCALTCLRSGRSHEDVDQLFGSLARFLVHRGDTAEEPADFQRLVQEFLDTEKGPFEEGRYALLLEQTRPWQLGEAKPVGFRFISHCAGGQISTWIGAWNGPPQVPFSHSKIFGYWQMV